ncbi:uncharacterized protein L201_000677 [Kwoniella dendrophila CBS 6074]|uniref:HTH psq-type domain-containing protein n=1 Tax=Kwoniella dendrophila CBS 6074 TaxID=1295534 RepID=A0AAX4JKA9_9TREE
MPKRSKTPTSDGEEEEARRPFGEFTPSLSITPPPPSQIKKGSISPKTKKNKKLGNGNGNGEEESEDTHCKPPTPKKPKMTTKESPSPGKGAGAFPFEAKKVLLEKAMELAYKSLPYSEISEELGISESRLKDQFKPGRCNLRKVVLELYSPEK